jgi:hypothetical protein
MEYLYTEKCHVPCHELPQVFQAANELLLTELTEGITLKVPLNTYLRLALTTEENRVALLELCNLADSVERPGLFIATSRPIRVALYQSPTFSFGFVPIPKP